MAEISPADRLVVFEKRFGYPPVVRRFGPTFREPSPPEPSRRIVRGRSIGIAGIVLFGSAASILIPLGALGRAGALLGFFYERAVISFGVRFPSTSVVADLARLAVVHRFGFVSWSTRIDAADIVDIGPVTVERDPWGLGRERLRVVTGERTIHLAGHLTPASRRWLERALAHYLS